MTVFLIILSVILIIIDFLIFCPISIKLVYDNDIKLRAGYLFPVFRILPQRPKDEAKKQKKAERKKKKAAKKAAKKPETESAEKSRKKDNFITDYKKAHGLDGLIELIKTLARIALEAVRKITDHTVISKMELHLLIGTDDAATTALTYGRACSAVFPLISVIENNVKKCRHKEYISPCFTITETKVYFVLKARIVPFFILSAAVKALIQTLRKTVFQKQ